MAAGTYRIEEILPSGLPDYRVDSTFNGEEATKGTVTVQDQKTATAEIVNTYTYDIVRRQPEFRGQQLRWLLCL